MKYLLAVKSKPVLAADANSRYSVPNLERGMLILELLGRHPAGLGLVEIARLLAIPNNSIFRIASTLTEMGYLHRCMTTRRFVLTRKLLGIGYAAVSQQNIVAASMEFLKQLRNDVKETVALATLLPQEARVLVLAQVKTSHAFGYCIEDGTRVELHSSAPGKAILAFLPQSEFSEVISKVVFTRFNEHTITRQEDLVNELAVVKQTGCAFDRQEMINGCHCVSAPVLDEHGYPVAAIWATGPSNRLTPEDLPAVAEIVKSAATKISERLGVSL